MVSLYAVSNVIDLLQAEARRDKVPTLAPGDTVKVHAKVEVMRSSKVRRAKLYYLRELKGKAARMKDTQKAES